MNVKKKRIFFQKHPVMRIAFVSMLLILEVFYLSCCSAYAYKTKSYVNANGDPISKPYAAFTLTNTRTGKSVSSDSGQVLEAQVGDIINVADNSRSKMSADIDFYDFQYGVIGGSLTVEKKSTLRSSIVFNETGDNAVYLNVRDNSTHHSKLTNNYLPYFFSKVDDCNNLEIFTGNYL